MTHYRIAGLPGDGIGPEVFEATRHVIAAAVDGLADLQVELTAFEAGAELYRRTGVALPDEVRQQCLDADAVLLAAIGLPDVRKPDGTEVQPDMMMGLRRAMDLFAAVRPVKLYAGATSPLKTTEAGIDLVIVRENVEGLFASFGGGAIVPNKVATDTIVITREGTERVVDFAFRLARRRHGRPLDGRRTLTCVDKANVFRSLAFFRQVFFERAAGFTDVHAEAVYVDAMSLYLVQNPADYDVLVMENQFGDILSDLGAGIVGGLGLTPSAELGNVHGLFQPSHGSAPQLAGRNLANPLATILSAAMMFDWLAEKHEDAAAAEAARRIERAVEHVLGDGRALTADLGGNTSTSEAGEAVVRALATEAIGPHHDPSRSSLN